MGVSQIEAFGLTGLTQASSLEIAAPRVAESPVALQCKVTKVQPLTDLADQALDAWIVFGQVVAVHIAHALLRDGIYGLAAAHPILRGGGPHRLF